MLLTSTEEPGGPDPGKPDRHRKHLQFLITSIVAVFILTGGVFYFLQLRASYACEAAAREMQEVVRQAKSASTQTEDDSTLNFNTAGEKFTACYTKGSLRTYNVKDEFMGTRYDSSGDAVLTIFVDRVEKSRTTLKPHFDNNTNQNCYQVNFYNGRAHSRLTIYENGHTEIKRIR